jgi:glycosyltransferase involved in cell wall biosynthesis
MPALVLVGSGTMEETLRQDCRTRGLAVADVAEGVRSQGSGGSPDRIGAQTRSRSKADVYFYGFRQIQELPVFYALAEAFILPSLEEEWGLVVNEAMAAGCPVLVSSAAGCCEDLVREGEVGWSFDPAQAGPLAGLLARFAADPSLSRRMGDAATRHIDSWSCANFARNAREAALAALARR